MGYDGGINLYAYVRNDPVNGADPSGTQEALALCFGGPFACIGGVAVTVVKIGVGVFVVTQLAGDTPKAKKATSEPSRKKSITVYRVHGGKSAPLGKSWTTVDPRTLPDARDALGLPSGNTATTLSIGQLVDSTGVIARAALPADGAKGGAPELVIPLPEVQIENITQEPFKKRRKDDDKCGGVPPCPLIPNSLRE